MSDVTKLTKLDILKINAVLISMNGKYDNKLKYAIKRNKDILFSHVKSIRESYDTKIERYNEYQLKAEKLLEIYADRDENGTIKQVENNPGYVSLDPKRIEEFKKDSALLENEYKDTIEARNIEVKNYEQLLKEEIEISIYKFSNNLIPIDLDQKNYEILFPLLND
jgi:hypothetical protein